jgi:dTDP-glucose pyrophosphorylase
MLNIVIPMAGRGSRFLKAGFDVPKPLIPVHGVPMIRLVIENIRPACPHRFVFICQRAHLRDHALEPKLLKWAAAEAEVVEVDGVTEGAACTVLGARDLIDNTEPLMIANSDQFIIAAIDEYLADMDARGLDGLIMTMRADDPKWSYAGVDKHGFVDRVVEKDPISPHATVGIYNFRHGRDFVRSAEAMVAEDERVNGEFYVAPVYNGLIAKGARVGVHDIGAEGDGMFGLGTPPDLERFVEQPIAKAYAAGFK